VTFEGEFEEGLITGSHVCVAVGGRPFVPSDPGVREYSITSDDLFSMKKSPGTLFYLVLALVR
jgi:thioredoxin reductase (NADPH)